MYYHFKGDSYTEDVRDQNAKENIWTSDLKDGCGKLCNEELRSLHSLYKMVREIKSYGVKLAEYFRRMGEERCA